MLYVRIFFWYFGCQQTHLSDPTLLTKLLFCEASASTDNGESYCYTFPGACEDERSSTTLPEYRTSNAACNGGSFVDRLTDRQAGKGNTHTEREQESRYGGQRMNLDPNNE